MMYVDMDTVKRINREHCQFFFEDGNTRLFRSRYPQFAIQHNDNKAYFVTSEQFDQKSPRLYTVRVIDLDTGIINTVGEFQEYKNSKQAYRAIDKITKAS